MVKYVLCETESHFNIVQDETNYRVTRPLQVFDTQESADTAMELFNSFYDYTLAVVRSDQLDESFR